MAQARSVLKRPPEEPDPIGEASTAASRPMAIDRRGRCFDASALVSLPSRSLSGRVSGEQGADLSEPRELRDDRAGQPLRGHVRPDCEPSGLQRAPSPRHGRATCHQGPPPPYRGPTCQALTKAGKPCGAGATASSAYARCFHHDESLPRSDKLAAVTRAVLIATRSYVGGVRPGTSLSLATPDQIEKAIEETAGRLLRGDLAPSIAVALTGLYHAALRAFEMNIARRVAELEQLARRGQRESRAAASSWTARRTN
jgi:hypothetical protein